MTDASDVAPVRPDEQLDASVVAGYLRGRLPGSDRPLEILQFPGGHANLTYLLRFGDREYVLRRPPLGPIAPRSHDMVREYRALAALGFLETFALFKLAVVLQQIYLRFVRGQTTDERFAAMGESVKRLAEIAVESRTR